MSYKLDQLFDDIVKVKGSLRKGCQADRSDYQKVWDAFNRYLTVTHQKRQTLNVHNFCKLGWRIEEFQGKARLRPHFQLAENFMRVFNAESKSHQCIPDRHFTSVEEFNFSKAAIRYSQSMTKDNIFMGLRAIVHQIGEATAAAREVSIDFEIGQLLCRDRDVRFVFMADIYAKEGLEVPEDALQTIDYKPSITFSATPSKDALTLSLQGKSQFSGSVKATSHGGWEDLELSPRSAKTDDTQAGQTDVCSVASEEIPRHLAHVEALTRHIGQMEADAAKAISEKHLWEGHLERCNALENKDLEWRRAIAKEHAEQLKLQISQDEARRAQSKEDFATKMTMHDFPCFREAADPDVRNYLHERRANLKQDLDQQVLSRIQMQQVQKERDRQLDLNNIEASQFEVQKIKKEELARRDQERAILAQAWDQDLRLKSVKKAIDEHHRTPGSKAALSNLVSNLSGSPNGGVTPLALPTPKLEMPAPRLDTPGAQSDRSSLASSRMSGSARRMPIGAAASLSLNKDKLKASVKK